MQPMRQSLGLQYFHFVDADLGFGVRVHSPGRAITGQTVQLYCNFTLPPSSSSTFFSLKWFLDKKEVHRYGCSK